MLTPRILLVVLLCACHRASRPDDLQMLTPVAELPTDSAILTRLQQQHPCASEIPRIRAGDVSQPPAVQCTLVTTAISAIQAGRGSPEMADDMQRFRAADARCAVIHVEAYRNDVTRDIELARWVVAFYSDAQPPLAVEIDRRTGNARVYRELEEFGYDAARLCTPLSSR